MFCHTTVPVNAMPAHLSMCQNAHSTAFPTVATSPYGSTQSIQYRRVVRVERKTVDGRTTHPIPVENNYSINQSHQKQIQWQNQSNPGWTLEDTVILFLVFKSRILPIKVVKTILSHLSLPTIQLDLFLNLPLLSLTRIVIPSHLNE